MFGLLEKIAAADEVEIETLLKAVLDRYAVLLPDREISVISLQKYTDKNKQLDRIIEFLQKQKTPL